MIKDKKLKNRSQAFQEIIGQAPHLLIRWGMTAVFFAVILLILLSWIIKYPEVVTVPLKVIQSNQLHEKPGGGKYYGQASIPEEFFVMIKKNQNVKIKLNAYPAHEFGLLPGTVADKRYLPGKQEYHLTIDLPDGLRTSYGKTIEYHPGMSGQAEITIKETRFIERVLFRLKSILDPT